MKTKIVEILKLKADAIAIGNQKQVSECDQKLRQLNLYQYNQGESVQTANENLRCFKASFSDKQIQDALAVEVWATEFNCPDEFCIAVLVGKNGYIGHRIIEGY